jgi:aspartate kinase
VKSIAYKEGLSIVTVTSTRMLMAYGFIASIFEVFNNYKTPVDLVSTSEVSVSMTVDSTDHLDDIRRELGRFATVEVEHNKAIVSLVGEQMKRTPGMPAKVFSLLDDVTIDLISQGASEINISFVINETDLPGVINRLHNNFFDNGLDPNIFAD